LAHEQLILLGCKTDNGGIRLLPPGQRLIRRAAVAPQVWCTGAVVDCWRWAWSGVLVVRDLAVDP